MAWFEQRSWQDEIRDDVGHHLTALRRELAALSGEAGRRGQKLAERYGHQLQHGAGEIGDALVHQGAAVARQVGRQARRAGQAVRNDPAPAVAAAIAVACVASLLLSRRR